MILCVIPAEAGIQILTGIHRVPECARMTIGATPRADSKAPIGRPKFSPHSWIPASAGMTSTHHAVQLRLSAQSASRVIFRVSAVVLCRSKRESPPPRDSTPRESVPPDSSWREFRSVPGLHARESDCPSPVVGSSPRCDPFPWPTGEAQCLYASHSAKRRL